MRTTISKTYGDDCRTKLSKHFHKTRSVEAELLHCCYSSVNERQREWCDTRIHYVIVANHDLIFIVLFFAEGACRPFRRSFNNRAIQPINDRVLKWGMAF